MHLHLYHPKHKEHRLYYHFLRVSSSLKYNFEEAKQENLINISFIMLQPNNMCIFIWIFTFYFLLPEPSVCSRVANINKEQREITVLKKTNTKTFPICRISISKVR